MGCVESSQFDRDAMKVMIAVNTGQDDSVHQAALGENLEKYTRIRLTSRSVAFDDIVNNWKVFRTVEPRQNVDSLKTSLRLNEAPPHEEVLSSFKGTASDINLNLRLSSGSSSIPGSYLK